MARVIEEPAASPAPGRVSAARRALPRRSALPAAVLGLVLLVAAALLYREMRGSTFWFDEWNWVIGRRGGGLSTYLEPHNQHLSLVPIALYKLLFATAGLDQRWPYRLMVIAAHLSCVTLLWIYGTRRVGAWLALVPAVLLLGFGPGWQNFLWPFQVAWLVSLGAGLGALLLIERRDRRGDVAAAGLLGLGLSSSGLGLPMAVAVAVELLWRRADRARLWVVGAPLGLYVLWYLAYGQSSVIEANVVRVLRFGADAAAAAAGALAGLTGPAIPDVGGSLQWGRPLALAAVVVLVWRVVLARGPTPRLAALVAGALAFWGLTALSRVNIANPYESRYLYVGALFILLIGLELARGVRVPPRSAALLVAVFAVVTVSNLGALHDGAKYLRRSSGNGAAELGAMELARAQVRPEFIPDVFRLSTVFAGAYFPAVAELGSAAPSAAELAAGPELAREAADVTLTRISFERDGALVLPLAPPGADAPVPGAIPPVVDRAGGGRADTSGGCARYRPLGFRPARVPALLELTVPAAGLVVTAGRDAPVRILVRRFAGRFSSPALGTLAPGASALLRFPADAAAATPWHVRLVPSGAVSACAARR